MRTSFPRDFRKPKPPPVKLVSAYQRQKHLEGIARFNRKSKARERLKRSSLSKPVEHKVSEPTTTVIEKDNQQNALTNLQDWLNPPKNFLEIMDQHEISKEEDDKNADDGMQSNEVDKEDEPINPLAQLSFAKAVLVSSRIKGTIFKLQQKRREERLREVAPEGEKSSLNEVLSLDTTVKHETLNGHTKGVRVLHIFRKYLLSGSEDSTIGVWSLSSNTLLRTLEGHSDHVLDIDTVGNWVVSSSRDCSILVWLYSPSSGHFQLIHKLYGHYSAVLRLAFFNNRNFYSISQDGTIRGWNAASGSCIFVMNEDQKNESISASDHFQCGKHTVLVTGGALEDEQVKLWSLEKHTLICTFEGHTAPVSCIAGWSALDLVISGSKDFTAIVWKLPFLSSELVFRKSPTIEEKAKQQQDKSIVSRLHHDDAVTCISPIYSSQNRAVTGCADGKLRVFEVESGELLQLLPGHSGWVLSVRVEGELAVSCSFDRTIRTWDLRTLDTEHESNRARTFEELWLLGQKKQREVFDGHEATVYKVAYSLSSPVVNTNTGKQHVKIYSCSADHSIRKWVLFSQDHSPKKQKRKTRIQEF